MAPKDANSSHSRRPSCQLKEPREGERKAVLHLSQRGARPPAPLSAVLGAEGLAARLVSCRPGPGPNSLGAPTRAWCQRIPAWIRGGCRFHGGPAGRGLSGPRQPAEQRRPGIANQDRPADLEASRRGGGFEPSGTPIRSIRAEVGRQALFSGWLVPSVGPTLRSQPAWVAAHEGMGKGGDCWSPSTGLHCRVYGKLLRSPPRTPEMALLTFLYGF